MDKEQIVTFEEETSVVRVAKPSLSSYSMQRLTSTPTFSIDDFLARPLQLATASWTTAQVVGTDVITVHAIADFLNFTQLAAKLADYRFFNATVVFRVLVNSQPFNVGRLMCWYEYFSDVISDPCPAVLTTAHGYSNVFVDAGNANVAELRLPFVSWNTSYDLLNDSYRWGSFRVRVFNVLKSAQGSNTAQVTVFGWFENANLAVPSANPLATPAHLVRVQPKSRPHSTGPPLPNISSGDFRPQSTESTSLAKTNVSTLPIKKIATAAKTAIDLVAPEFSFLGNAVEWVGDALADSASQKGYCKPVPNNVTMRHAITPAYGLCNANGADNSVVLGTDLRNQIDLDPTIFKSSKDEMDIGTIVAKPHYFATFTWAASAAPGTVLFKIPITPCACGTTGVPTEAAPTFISYIGSMFKFWSGGISYKFDFVKNSFYSGRVRVSYVSGWTISNIVSPLPAGFIDPCPSIICDIRERDSCSYDLEFVSNRVWLETIQFKPGGTGDFSDVTAGTPRFALGSLVVSVLSPLTNTGMSSSDIDVNVFISGSEDTAFAVPLFESYSPQSMGEASSNLPNEMGCRDDMRHKFLQTSTPGVVAPAAISIGESVTSLRTLTRMFSGLDVSDPCTSYQYDPMWMGTSGNIQTSLHYVSRLYRMFRGSSRLKLYVTNLSVGGTSQVPLMAAWLDFDLGVPFAPTINTPSTVPSISFTWLHHANVNPITEVVIPNYRGVVASVRGLTSGFQNGMHPTLNLTSYNPTPVSFQVKPFVAAGDDFTFGLLIGPPIITML